MKNIHKRFPGVYALDGVHLDVMRGEVHAILGENGAGKSTLIKVLGAIYKPEQGEIYIDGKLAQMNTIRDAQNNGISIIHQELMLVPDLSIADNIFLGSKPDQYGYVNRKESEKNAQKLLDNFGVNLDSRSLVSSLSVAQQQIVEIVKAISVNAKIIVMDEPTSSLSTNEVQMLFEIIKRLKSEGVSIIYISHKLDELFTITDRITVMRDGKTIGTVITKDVTTNQLIRMMVARELSEFYVRSNFKKGEVVLSVRNLTKKGALNNISFDLHKGEILGFAGLVGAGRTELMKAIFGLTDSDCGEIYFNNRQVKIHSPREAMKVGIALVPENRKEEGLILKNSVGFNMTITVLKDFIKGIFVNSKKEKEILDVYKDRLSINTPSYNQLVSNLSGGNQQKVVVSKWLAANPRVLLLDEPTRGIDVGAKAEMYSIMNELTLAGMSIIMVSSEMQEVIAMSDRICVMNEGSITTILDKDDFSQENILAYAIGGNN
jgi:ribose transport system ATP-binding protein/inositol transport system ATP-binding protein